MKQQVTCDAKYLVILFPPNIGSSIDRNKKIALFVTKFSNFFSNPILYLTREQYVLQDFPRRECQ